MSHFSIHTDELRIQEDTLKSTTESIKNLCSSISTIESQLALKTNSGEQIKHHLRKLHEELLEEAAKMSSFSKALAHIANTYEKTEKYIIDNTQQINIENIFNRENGTINRLSDKIKEWIRNVLITIGIVPAQRQERTEGEKVTRYQEKEQDIYMKREIQRISDSSQYSEKSWEEASVEERKNMLNDYIKKVAEIMGLEIDAINFISSESENGYVTMGSYNTNTGSISINEWVIENGDANGFSSYNLFSTVVHELRHAYQYQACNNPDKFVVTEETIEKWQESFDNYRSTDAYIEEGMNERDAFNAYRNQEVERDARAFAGQR